jgi:hypothetical protein
MEVRLGLTVRDSDLQPTAQGAVAEFQAGKIHPVGITAA